MAGACNLDPTRIPAPRSGSSSLASSPRKPPPRLRPPTCRSPRICLVWRLPREFSHPPPARPRLLAPACSPPCPLRPRFPLKASRTMPIASLPSLQSLDRDTLVQLAQVEAAMTVTFYAPLLPAGDAPQAGLPGWEDLLARAVAGLRRHGWETATIRRLVEPVRHWSEPGLVIKQAATPAGGNAVAAFLAAEHPPVLCRLPFSLASSMAHGRAFSLLPAMPVLQEKPRFLLLLLTL